MKQNGENFFYIMASAVEHKLIGPYFVTLRHILHCFNSHTQRFLDEFVCGSGVLRENTKNWERREE